MESRNTNHNLFLHQSRLKREMLAARVPNPFGSPPSSTGSRGSYGTVSTSSDDNDNDITIDFTLSPPDAESTRKLDEDINLPALRSRPARTGRFEPKSKPTYQINTSLLARRFPEWSADPTASTSKEANTGPVIPNEETKENNAPTFDDTFPEDTNTLDSRFKRTRAEMQPSVQNESDCSTVLTHISPQRAHAATRTSRFSRPQALSHSISPPSPDRPPLQDLVSKLRNGQSTFKSQSAKVDAARKQSPPEEPATRLKRSVPAEHQRKQVSPAPKVSKATTTFNPSTNVSGFASSPTARSFFVPVLSHLPDWTSGTLKFSTMRNGVPVFVKHGKACSRLSKSQDVHAEVDVLDLPEEEQKIFVSMDKLREEVVALQDHDSMLQKEAEKLQDEVHQLHSELQSLRSRKRSDSAIGSSSDSEDSINQRLNAEKKKYEAQVAALQDRLDKAQRQLGIHDIHSNALIAERDEALNQSHDAHARAKKLQAELESTQNDLESTLQYRNEKHTLQLENTSLRADNDVLRHLHQSVSEDNHGLRSTNKALTTELEALRGDHAATQKVLTRVREQLARLQTEHEACLKKTNIDHQLDAAVKAAEAQHDENGALRDRIGLQEKHIAELEKQLAKRDRLIEDMQNDVFRNTGASLQVQKAQLEAEVNSLTNQLQSQQDELAQRRDGNNKVVEWAKQRVQTSQNEWNTARAKYESDTAKWEASAAKFERVAQRMETEYQKLASIHNVFVEKTKETRHKLDQELDQANRELGQAKQRLDRRTAAIRKAKQLTHEITKLSISSQSTNPAKATRIVDPTQPSEANNYTTSDFTAKSSVLNIDNDPTTQVDVTRGSDFASVFSDGEIPKLKQMVRQLRQLQQQQNLVDDSASENTVETIDADMTPHVAPAMQRSKSDDAMQRNSSSAPKMPSGILKKTTQVTQQEDITGRFSVKSGMSAFSVQNDITDMSATSACNHKSAKSVSNAPGTAPRPESRLHRRAQSDNARLSAEQNRTDDNITSAFFVPDITLQSDKQPTVENVGPSLTKPARQVLNGLCEHSRHNCGVCLRISSATRKHTSSSRTTTSKTTTTGVRDGKTKLRIQKPIPVSDRMPEPGQYEEEPTLRPSQPPGNALATVIKGIEDELAHLQLQLERKRVQYGRADKSLGARERRRLADEVRQLVELCEIKSDQLYALYDVLEGQKEAGQEMTREELEVTIASIMTGSSEGEWNGFD